MNAFRDFTKPKFNVNWKIISYNHTDISTKHKFFLEMSNPHWLFREEKNIFTIYFQQEKNSSMKNAFIILNAHITYNIFFI